MKIILGKPVEVAQHQVTSKGYINKAVLNEVDTNTYDISDIVQENVSGGYHTRIWHEPPRVEKKKRKKFLISHGVNKDRAYLITNNTPKKRFKTKDRKRFRVNKK